MSEEEARIALVQEYWSNTRNWYGVLLGLAIVFFTVVQVRDDLQKLGVAYWPMSLSVIFSQTAYVIIRAFVNLRLGETAVDIPRSVGATDRNYLKILRDKTTDEVKKKYRWKIGLWLGTAMGWSCWTILTFSLVFVVLVLLGV
jgi:hypothetical protein